MDDCLLRRALQLDAEKERMISSRMDLELFGIELAKDQRAMAETGELLRDTSTAGEESRAGHG